MASLDHFYGNKSLEEWRKNLFGSNISFPENTTTLNPTLPSRFTLDAPFQTIVDELTIEQWNPTASYQHFFDKCRPISCSFTYRARPNFFIILGITIGLIGGLNKILRLICPLLVRFFLCTDDHAKAQPASESKFLSPHQYFLTELHSSKMWSSDILTYTA